MILRELGAKDKSKLINLSNIVVDNLECKELYIPFSREEIDKMFKDKDVLYYGFFDGARLMACSALYSSEEYVSEKVKILGIQGKIWGIGHCMVAPEYRGNNIMFKINKELIKIASEKNADYVVIIASPKNIYSIKSIEKLGAEKKGHYIKDDKYLRNIYLLDLKTQR